MRTIIEDISIKEGKHSQESISKDFTDMIITIKELKAGQSFTMFKYKFTSNYQNVIAVTAVSLEIILGTRTEGDKIRIGRIY